MEGKVKKKHLCHGWNFSTFAAHLVESGLFWSTAPGARLLGLMAQRLGFPLPAVFIASLQRSLSVPKPTKPNRGQAATIVLLETLRLIQDLSQFSQTSKAWQ